MKNKLTYTFNEHLQESLEDSVFQEVWRESEAEYLLATRLIALRLAKKMSQRELAKKVKTSQAAISRIEAMRGNPSLSLLKRIATALDLKLNIAFS
jgi:DNA-binding XRE family transcriptional regulator